MDNNELNNNINTNFGDQIMMGDTPETPVNQQPVNAEQGINTILQNNMEQNQTINTQPVSDPQPQTVDTIFPDVEPKVSEPITPVVQDSTSEPTPVQPVVQPEVTQPIQEPVQESTIPTEPVVTDKKKKTPIIIVILLVVVLLGLGGYIVYDKFIAKEDVKKQEVTPSKKEEKKVLLKDSNLEIVYSDVDEMHNGKVKKVPYINIDSKYADEVNNEIKTMLNKGLEGQISEASYGIDYQYYINGDILSVKFTWETESGTQTYSKIYNINQYTGEKVTNSEILKQVNLDETTFNDKLVESYKSARPFDSIENKDMWKDCYQKDVDAFTKGTFKGMYINDGELYVLFDMSYPAGAEIGEALLNVTANKLIQNPFTLE